MRVPEFSIDKALQFVGDNSIYQKKHLLFLCIAIITFATLTCNIPLLFPHISVPFLLLSGVGQFFCPIYLSLRTCTICLLSCTLCALVMWMLGELMLEVGVCLMGMFGRGLWVSAFIYLQEIGGDRFRAWAGTALLGVWAVAPLLLSLERLVHTSTILWMLIFVGVPFLLSGNLILKNWNPSPLHLYTKKQYTETKKVLNQIAACNSRPPLPYGLEGQNAGEQQQYKKQTYWEFLSNPYLFSITMPILAIWTYREYIYYSSYMLLPYLGAQVNRNLVLMAVSQIVAVLMSYPIKLKIKRISTLFCCVVLVCACSLVCSFSTVDQECQEHGQQCGSKYAYRIAIMVIRFSVTLLYSVLIQYTLEVYPSDVRKLGFCFCVGMSGVGSVLMPWVVELLLYVGLSGFIAFAVVSAGVLYFVLKLEETNGNMKNVTLQQMQNHQPLISLENWANLRFQ